MGELQNWAAFFKYGSLLLLLFLVPIVLFLVLAGIIEATYGFVPAVCVVLLVWYAVDQLVT